MFYYLFLFNFFLLAGRYVSYKHDSSAAVKVRLQVRIRSSLDDLIVIFTTRYAIGEHRLAMATTGLQCV